MKRFILNVIGFNAGWLSCVLAPVWVGVLVVAVVVAVNLRLDPHWRRTARRVAIVAGLGAILDTGLLLVGILGYPGDGIVPPLFVPWIIALWVNFSMTLPVSFRWLARRPILSAVLGAFGGSTTYYAGARLGDLSLGEPLWLAMLVLAVEWAIVMPLATPFLNRGDDQ